MTLKVTLMLMEREKIANVRMISSRVLHIYSTNLNIGVAEIYLIYILYLRKVNYLLLNVNRKRMFEPCKTFIYNHCVTFSWILFVLVVKWATVIDQLLNLYGHWVVFYNICGNFMGKVLITTCIFKIGFSKRKLLQN